MSETVLMTRSRSSTDRRIVRGADEAACAFRGCNRDWRGRSVGARRERIDERAVVAARHLLAGFDRRDHLADTVDDRENGADQRSIGLAPAGTNVGERVLGGMAKGLKARKIEEAAIALHGVDEPENVIESRAIVGLGLPGDDLAAKGFEHFAAFGYEIGNQVIHRLRPPSNMLRGRYAEQVLTRR